ncbi:MAG TPA: GNAT family N-acetyltransferase [Clostridium sp.]|nr:GNAT family N-acetyltransferase [Clostridium sp.]
MCRKIYGYLEEVNEMKNEVKLLPIDAKSQLIFKNLMTLHLHDLSEFADDLKINSEGLFEYDGIEYYFKSEDLKPFFIYVNTDIAGFVLLNSGKYVSENIDYSVHELFLMKAYRKKGIASIVVEKLFELYKGNYKVVQLYHNTPAINF